jgi:hypothetical protein
MVWAMFVSKAIVHYPDPYGACWRWIKHYGLLYNRGVKEGHVGNTESSIFIAHKASYLCSDLQKVIYNLHICKLFRDKLCFKIS